MRISIIVVLALFGASARADDGLLDKGRSTYKQLCAHCHGMDMVNPGTSSFDLRKFPTAEKARFYESVTKGRGDMPAWGDILIADELNAIWYYVATRAGTEPMPAEPAGE